MTALAFRNGRKCLYGVLRVFVRDPLPDFMFHLAELLVHGDIRANGVPVDSSYMMANSGYMHQEDIFVETMTVVEHLWFMVRNSIYE